MIFAGKYPNDSDDDIRTYNFDIRTLKGDQSIDMLQGESGYPGSVVGSVVLATFLIHHVRFPGGITTNTTERYVLSVGAFEELEDLLIKCAVLSVENVAKEQDACHVELGSLDFVRTSTYVSELVADKIKENVIAHTHST